MPYEIIDIGTVQGTRLTRVVVRSWRTEEDRTNGVRPREETHDFDEHRLAPARVQPVRNEQGQFRLTTGEFIDEAELYDQREVRVIHPIHGERVVVTRERKPGLQLAVETVDGKPHERLREWLDRYYAHLYADDAKDTRQPIDDSDPAGIFSHPEMAALKAGVKSARSSAAAQESS